MYPEDETGLNGSIDRYMKLATENKAVDPQLMNYANPNGSISIDNILEMEPITELWQPMMEIIEFWGPDFVNALKKRNQPVLVYTPPGNVRVLRPLGFFRSQPYISLHWGIDGGGWYAYIVRDLWGSHPADEPDYGAADFDGRAVVPSRRWEASRDGIEDFNALFILRELATEKNDQDAQAVFEKAVTSVASQAITGMPREAAEYDLDFGELMDHRMRVRQALERLQD
jgi:hypothetical protein